MSLHGAARWLEVLRVDRRLIGIGRTRGYAAGRAIQGVRDRLRWWERVLEKCVRRALGRSGGPPCRIIVGPESRAR